MSSLVSKLHHSQSRTAAKTPSSLPNRAQRLVNAARFLKPKALSAEADLIGTKWPAYRGFDPMQANIHFGTEYQAAFRQQYRIDVDYKEAQRVRGIDIASLIFPKDTFGVAAKGGQLTNINAARQIADAVGLPYEVFVKFCMQFASDRGVKHISRPNQLVPQGKFRDAWDRELEKTILGFKEAMIWRYQEELKRGFSGEPGCLGVVAAESATCATCPFSVKCTDVRERVVRTIRRKGMHLYAEKHAAKIKERNRVKADLEKERRAARKAAALNGDRALLWSL